MLVEEVDVTIVDSLCDLLAHLMRRPALDHVKTCPSILSLSTRRGANEEIVLELALEVVLLDMIGKRSWDFPTYSVSTARTSQSSFRRV